MSTLETLNGIFREVFDDATLRIAPEMTAGDVDGWDSLSHVNLVMAVEMAFKVRFAQKELLVLRNVGDLVRLVDAHLAR